MKSSRRQEILHFSHKINQKSRFSIVHRNFVIKTYIRVKDSGVLFTVSVLQTD